ncbi:5007_t:CDS:2 [Scutellospora calospora]|uniref:5007_t:CDS:1 n=1 Tax=Scutellospora calospora TaxID=85575 RepID=A0ACA9M2D7_9GLOM|nr:5007_t:CDS:2 [Scutellospora calospora]
MTTITEPPFPFELYWLIFEDLDNDSLHNVSKVSRYWHSLASNNKIWRQFALKCWENKEGMREIQKEIRKEPYKLWEKPSTWKRVHFFIEKEAKRTSWDVKDLVENSWHCRWSFADNGSMNLNDKLFKQSRSPDWNFIIKNDSSTFTSAGEQSFRRKLKEFNETLTFQYSEN